MPETTRTQRQLEDRQFILHEEDNWPHWPVLPIIRTVNNEREAAFIYSLGATPPKFQVIFENIFRFQGLNNEQRKAVRMEIYDSVDALLDDGWRVD